jgi:hypothetical protein
MDTDPFELRSKSLEPACAGSSDFSLGMIDEWWMGTEQI